MCSCRLVNPALLGELTRLAGCQGSQSVRDPVSRRGIEGDRAGHTAVLLCPLHVHTGGTLHIQMVPRFSPLPLRLPLPPPPLSHTRVSCIDETLDWMSDKSLVRQVTEIRHVSHLEHFSLWAWLVCGYWLNGSDLKQLFLTLGVKVFKRNCGPSCRSSYPGTTQSFIDFLGDLQSPLEAEVISYCHDSIASLMVFSADYVDLHKLTRKFVLFLYVKINAILERQMKNARNILQF